MAAVEEAAAAMTMIPVLSVLKKGSILKNIILNVPQSPSSPSQEEAGIGVSGQDHPAPILVGRHPDCHVLVDHPSISRFHLELRADPASKKLSVIDRSSVHGTWVSGRKIEPMVPVDLAEGDTLRLGASTRVYELQWMSLSQIQEMERPLEALLEEKEESQHESSGLAIDSSNRMCASEIPSAPLMPDEFFSSPIGRDTQESQSLARNSSVPVDGEKSIQEDLLGMRLEKPVRSSSLLSRRSKSIGFLRIPSGRSKESIGHISDGEVDIEVQEKGCVELEQGDTEKALQKVLFGDFDGEEKEEEEREFGSDNKNVTPFVSMNNKNMEGMLTELQKLSLDAIATLKLEDAFYNNKERKSEMDEEGEDEKFASDKENLTPGISLDWRFQKSIAFGMGEGYSDVESWTPEPLKYLSLSRAMPEKHMKGENEEEAHTSDRENLTPDVSKKLRKSLFGLSRSSPSAIILLNVEEDGSNSDREKWTPEVPKCPSLKKPMSENLVNRYEEDGTFASNKNLTPDSVGKNLKSNDLAFYRSSSNSILSFNAEDVMSNSDKENLTPKGPKALSSKKSMSLNQVSSEKNETYASGKEYLTPESLIGKKLKKSNLVLYGSSSRAIRALNSEEDLLNSDKENQTPRKLKLKSSASANHVKGREGQFAPDKENLTSDVSEALRSNKILAKSHAEIEREIMKRRVGRIPFQSLLNSPIRTNSSDSHSQKMIDRGSTPFVNSNLGTSSPAHIQETVNKSDMALDQSVKKKWNLVVDSSCFLDEDSRRSLQLLVGLRGTQLIIPRMVIRELDCIKRRESWFCRTTKASSALRWIEECMVKRSWWIHVQNSTELIPVAATPPATPTSGSDEGSGEFGDAASNSTSSGTYGSLVEILSPTAEDHILDCALLFKRMKTDGPLILLTNTTTLRIKAMAEGLLCETPMEFRESLVNPYSKRFMWVESSARGSTWSCTDEMSLIENYCCHQFLNTRKTVKAADHAKGLKLILLHNSQYGKIY